MLLRNTIQKQNVVMKHIMKNNINKQTTTILGQTRFRSSEPLADYQPPPLDQSFKPNAPGSKMPEFRAMDNSSVTVDMAKHHKEDWGADEIDKAIVDNSVYSWGASDPIHALAVQVERAEGVYFYDKDGKKYIDWSAGAVCSNLGHTVPEQIQNAASKQMENVAFVYGDLAINNPRARLANLLSEMVPGDINGFFFASGGSEANECAIRAARRYTGRPKIMSRPRSYHGGSTSSLAMTGDQRNWFVDGTASGFVKMVEPFPLHYKWDEDVEKASEKCLNALHDQILFEGSHTIAAIVLEAVTGANGWLKTPTSFMQGVRALCDEYGILLISDEVMNGFGRTGKMFGFQHFDGVMPDMISFAKGVTSAYLPLSGVGMSDDIFNYFRTNPLGYGSTYFAHPVCCAVAYETLKYTIDNDIVGHVQKMEKVMEHELAKIVDLHPSVKQARVVGLGAGFDLAGKDGNFLMNMHEVHPGVQFLKERFKEEGLVTLMRGHHVHCTPPLIINEDEIKEGCKIINRCLDDLDDFIMK